MKKSSHLILAAVTSSLLLCVLSADVSAQINPTMPSQSSDNLKESLYAQFNDYRKSINPDERKYAYPAAKDYLRKFGGDNDTNAKDVQKFITDYERAAYYLDIFAAYNAKNYAKAMNFGRPISTDFNWRSKSTRSLCLKMRFSRPPLRMPAIIDAWFLASEKITTSGIRDCSVASVVSLATNAEVNSSALCLPCKS